jgi:hypothetical protein
MASPNAKISNAAVKAPNAAPKNVGPVTNAGLATSASSSSAGIVGKMQDFLKKNMLVVIFIGIVLLIFIIVIVFIIFSMKGRGLKAKTLSKAPIKLDGNNTPKSIEGDGIPVPVVGREYTYSYWVYLDSYGQTPGSQKMLWYRSDDSSVASANPIVYMDDMSNKMYIVLKTQNSVLTSGSEPNTNYDADIGLVKTNNYFLNKNLTLNDNNNKHIIMTVDYVPLQRWVNYSIIVDNKMVTIYMDGEIYSVKSIDEFKSLKTAEVNTNGNKIDYNLIIDNTAGNIFLGKNPTGTHNITISGYLSKFDFFNYAVSSDDIKKIYNVGPFTKSFLSLIGAGQYSVRSPVYKIGSSSASSN